MRRADFIFVAVVTLGAGACSAADELGPDAALSTLVGDWQAERFQVTNKTNAKQSPELIHDLGAQFSLNIQPSGQYTAILAYQGTPITEIGTLSLEQSDVVFHVSYPAPETSRSRYTLSSSRLTLDGDTEFDFNGDGKGDPAIAHVELKKR